MRDLHSEIGSEIIRSNLISEVITNQNSLENKFLCLKENTLFLRAKLSFTFEVLVELESYKEEFSDKQTLK